MINATPRVPSLSGSCMRCGSITRPKGVFVLTMARHSLVSISTIVDSLETRFVATSGCRWGYIPGGAHVPVWSSRRPFSSSPQPSPSDSSHASVSAWLRGLSPSERAMVHQRLRGAQAALSLQHAFSTGDVKCSLQSTPELESLLRESRARPSLLVPVAAGLGALLHKVTGLVPSPIRSVVSGGVEGGVHDHFDNSVRALLTTSTTHTQAGGEGVKAFFKQQRDSSEGGEASLGDNEEPPVIKAATQATKTLVGLTIDAAARV